MKNKESKKKDNTKTNEETEPESLKNEKQVTGDRYIIMDMPEVNDIPGQEKIRPPKMREMMDTTPSSADEEGEGLLDDLNKEDDSAITDNRANVSRTERRLLRRSGQPVTDETKDLKNMQLDSSDGEDPLNEKTNPKDMGEDLDIPGTELDDADENVGEEDEENNPYSRPD